MTVIFNNTPDNKPDLPKKAAGGMVEGPSHEEGGVQAVNTQSGEPVAEVEGGERIFSTEDTQAMEEASAQIMQLSEQDPAAADEAAKQLGYMVVQMLMAQAQNAAGGQQGATADDVYASAANNFSNS